MKVLVFNQQSDLQISSQSVKSIVKEVLLFEKRITDEVSVYFVSTEKICSLHQEFFNDPSPTDCISFPMDDALSDKKDYQILGEVFICPKTAIDYVCKNQGEIYQEVTLYLVHTLLHLLGFDDIEKSDRLRMRRKEKVHMSNLIDKHLLISS